MDIVKSTPLGARFICAFFVRHVRQLLKVRPAQRHTRISEQIARDIGLSPAELERLHLRLPSSHLQHPYW